MKNKNYNSRDRNTNTSAQHKITTHQTSKFKTFLYFQLACIIFFEKFAQLHPYFDTNYDTSYRINFISVFSQSQTFKQSRCSYIEIISVKNRNNHLNYALFIK